MLYICVAKGFPCSAAHRELYDSFRKPRLILNVYVYTRWRSSRRLPLATTTATSRRDKMHFGTRQGLSPRWRLGAGSWAGRFASTCQEQSHLRGIDWKTASALRLLRVSSKQWRRSWRWACTELLNINIKLRWNIKLCWTVTKLLIFSTSKYCKACIFLKIFLIVSKIKLGNPGLRRSKIHSYKQVSFQKDLMKIVEEQRMHTNQTSQNKTENGLFFEAQREGQIHITDFLIACLINLQMPCWMIRLNTSYFQCCRIDQNVSP